MFADKSGGMIGRVDNYIAVGESRAVFLALKRMYVHYPTVIDSDDSQYRRLVVNTNSSTKPFFHLRLSLKIVNGPLTVTLGVETRYERFAYKSHAVDNGGI